MKVIEGDLIKLAKAGEFDVIVHGCNCFHTMNAGVAKTISDAFPRVYTLDKTTRRGSIEKLGTCVARLETMQAIERNIIIVNAYTQYLPGRVQNLDLLYKAVRDCFKIIKHKYSGFKIGYPAIGAGIAGGDWNVISRIIDDALEGEDHTFVKYAPEADELLDIKWKGDK